MLAARSRKRCVIPGSDASLRDERRWLGFNELGWRLQLLGGAISGLLQKIHDIGIDEPVQSPRSSLQIDLFCGVCGTPDIADIEA